MAVRVDGLKSPVADCLYTGISSGFNARKRVWENFNIYRATAISASPATVKNQVRRRQSKRWPRESLQWCVCVCVCWLLYVDGGDVACEHQRNSERERFVRVDVPAGRRQQQTAAGFRRRAMSRHFALWTGPQQRHRWTPQFHHRTDEAGAPTTRRCLHAPTSVWRPAWHQRALRVRRRPVICLVKILLLLGPFHGAITVPSVTRCRCCRCCCGHQFYIAIHQVSLLSHAACAIAIAGFGSSCLGSCVDSSDTWWMAK